MPVSFSVCEGLCGGGGIWQDGGLVGQPVGPRAVVGRHALPAGVQDLRQTQPLSHRGYPLQVGHLQRLTTLWVKFTPSHNICVICKSLRPSSNSLSSKILFTSMSSITFQDMICKLTLFIMSALSTSTNNKNLKIDLELTSFN